jgi:hypothetical protein
MIEALNMVEVYCETVISRSQLLSAKSCPPELKDAVSNIIYCAPYLAMEELAKVRRRRSPRNLSYIGLVLRCERCRCLCVVMWCACDSCARPSSSATARTSRSTASAMDASTRSSPRGCSTTRPTRRSSTTTSRRSPRSTTSTGKCPYVLPVP